MQPEPYHVLIVDDEEICRRGIIRLIEEHCPRWQVVAEAKDVQEALDTLSQISVDLVITDIKMEGLSGFDLIERLLSNRINLEIMIISGYGDFPFTQRAMRHRIFNYLLKPLNMKEFIEILNDITQKLDANGLGHENYAIEYYNSIINSILNNDITAQDHLKSFFPDIMCSYTIMAIDMDLRNASLPHVLCDDLSFLTNIREELKRLCAVYCRKALVFFRNKSLWGVVISEDERNHIAKLWELLQDTLHRNYSIACYIGISEAPDLTSDFSACFFRAYRAAKVHLLDNVSFHAFDQCCFPVEYDLDESCLNRLYAAINAGCVGDSQSIIDDIFHNIAAAGPDIFQLSRLIHRLSYDILRALEKVQILDDKILSCFEVLQNTQSFHSLEAIKQTSRVLIDHAGELFQERMETRYSRIIEATMAYIDQHYNQDLGIIQLAELSSINENYLSTRFKSETGMTVLEYITYIRMEKAKSLLIETSRSLSDITQTIGYRDVKYFIRAFKKNIGITPNVFRSYNR